MTNVGRRAPRLGGVFLTRHLDFGECYHHDVAKRQQRDGGQWIVHVQTSGTPLINTVSYCHTVTTSHVLHVEYTSYIPPQIGYLWYSSSIHKIWHKHRLFLPYKMYNLVNVILGQEEGITWLSFSTPRGLYQNTLCCVWQVGGGGCLSGEVVRKTGVFKHRFYWPVEPMFKYHDKVTPFEWARYWSAVHTLTEVCVLVDVLYSPAGLHWQCTCQYENE